MLLAFANDATDTDISSSDNDTTSAETFDSVATNWSSVDLQFPFSKSIDFPTGGQLCQSEWTFKNNINGQDTIYFYQSK